MRGARGLGIACQAVVLGTLLALAVTELLASTTGGQIFRYQGF